MAAPIDRDQYDADAAAIVRRYTRRQALVSAIVSAVVLSWGLVVISRTFDPSEWVFIVIGIVGFIWINFVVRVQSLRSGIARGRDALEANGWRSLDDEADGQL